MIQASEILFVEASSSKGSLLAYVSGPLFCSRKTVDGLFQLPQFLWSAPASVVVLNPVRFFCDANLSDYRGHVSTERARTFVFGIRANRKVIGFVERRNNFLEVSRLESGFLPGG